MKKYELFKPDTSKGYKIIGYCGKTTTEDFTNAFTKLRALFDTASQIAIVIPSDYLNQQEFQEYIIYFNKREVLDRVKYVCFNVPLIILEVENMRGVILNS